MITVTRTIRYRYANEHVAARDMRHWTHSDKQASPPEGSMPTIPEFVTIAIEMTEDQEVPF